MAASADRPDPWKTLGKLVAALAAAGVLVAGFLLPYVGGLGLVAGAQADKFDNTACNLQESKPPQRTTLYARDGKTVLATLFSQDRVEIGLDQVPQALQDALVATEDRRFYTHHGVDMRGLLRSAVSTTGGETQGGSTLTMQYVKQIRYYEAGDDVKKQAAAIEQNLNRKIEDAKCAIYIEENLKESKQTILQNYLNIAFFGENAYGLQTAARTYFNKPASQLTLEESALLVGLLRAPSAYDPFVNRVAAKERRDQVIQNLVAVGKLSQAQADVYKAKPISLATDAPPRVKQGCANSSTSIQNAGFFCEYVRDWLGRTGLSAQQLQTGGYKIVTTLDPTIQNSAQKRIVQSVPASSPYTASLPVVDPKTGDVLAMAASKQYGTGKNETEQPIFTTQVASGASTFKLFPLLAALNVGVPSDWTLDSTDGSADGKYRAKNCLTPATAVNDERRQFNRNESLDSATAKSSNTFFVAFADQFLGCNVSPIVNVASQLGITSFAAKENKTQTVGQYIVSQQQALRLVLGNVETSPLEITGAYAGIANQGKFNAPAPVLSITDSDGNALPVKRTAGTQVVAPIVADQAVQILEGDTKGDGTSSDVFGSWYGSGGSAISGKTGTAVAIPTSKNGAIWFAGMTPDLVATAAIINYDNPNKPNSGLPGVKTGVAYGDYAAKVWLDSLGSTLKGQNWTWESPDSAQGIDVPDVSGDSLSSAQRTLTDAGFRFVRLNADDDLLCPSGEPLNTVGYYGPLKAPAGSTITVCSSLGKSQPIYSAPQPAPQRQQPRSNAPRGGTSSSAPSSSAPSGGATGGGRGNGGGNGGGRGNGGG